MFDRRPKSKSKAGSGYPWEKLSRQELVAQIEDQIDSLSGHMLHWLGNHPRDRARWHGVLCRIDYRTEASQDTVVSLLGMFRAFRGEAQLQPAFARNKVFQSRLEIIESELGNLRILLQYLHRR